MSLEVDLQDLVPGGWGSQRQKAILELQQKLNPLHPKLREQAQAGLGERPDAVKPDEKGEERFQKILEQTG